MEMPPTGSIDPVADGVIRVVAPNPSPMTASGTATYVVGAGADRAVIDPGPDAPEHRDAILSAAEGAAIRAILVTHPHLDHTAGTAALVAATDAPVHAFGRFDAGRSAAMTDLPDLGGGEGADRGFVPDEVLADGDVVAGDGWALRALHTPGHMGPHLSFHWPDRGLAFTGDVAMGWASTLISPPDGDVTAFLSSLDRLRALDARLLLPGHGPAITAPTGRLDALRDHRIAREAAIRRALTPDGVTIPELVASVYDDVPDALRPMAARNVLAHLIRLVERGEAATDRIAPGGIFRTSPLRGADGGAKPRPGDPA